MISWGSKSGLFVLGLGRAFWGFPTVLDYFATTADSFEDHVALLVKVAGVQWVS